MYRSTGLVFAAACLVGCLLIASPGYGIVCSGTSWSNIDIFCGDPGEAWREIPCGETVFSPEGPANPTCPDPNLSAICIFNCGPGVAFMRDVDALAVSRWAEELEERVGESCGAYAVLPIGWEKDPKAPAKLFFTVGRRIHHIVLSWPHFHAEDAVLEGRFFEPVLGSVGESPLWGGKIVNDRALLRSAGICIHEVGALLGSPHWGGGDGYGYSRFPVATLCGSPAAEARAFMIYSSTEPKIEGLEARPIVERLRELAKRSAMELVCVTPRVAEERRKLLGIEAARDRR